jgi:LysM repeat protein
MKTLFTTLITVLSIALFGQPKPDILAYINQYQHVAIEEMVRTKIPASITMAQGILESGCGKSPLARQANNHFGIKCKADWNGKKFIQDDDEANECFRVYEHAEASYVDHSDFLLTRFRYAQLFDLPSTDYKAWANGLKELGYATNPKYATILTTYIETYKLHELDLAALAQIDEKEKLLTRSESDKHAAAPATKMVVQETKPVEIAKTAEPVIVNYVKEELSINGLRAVRATGDEDPLKIAFDYGLDYSTVLAYNDLNNGERFKKGENIFLQAKKSRAEDAAYKVQAGESMRDVAQRFGIKLKDLYAKNLMKMNDQVYTGETLYLQNTRPEAARTMSYYEYLGMQNHRDSPTSIQLTEKSSQYRVQQSDTLYSIAKKFNTTVEELQKLNNLASAEVKAGQTLVVVQ